MYYTIVTIRKEYYPENQLYTITPYHAGHRVSDGSGQRGVTSEHRDEQRVLFQTGPPRADHTHGGKVGRIGDTLIMGLGMCDKRYNFKKALL